MTTEKIEQACRKHGAKGVSDAAYLAMEGKRHTLAALGLGDITGLAGLHEVTTIAYRLMPDEDQAADLTRASIDGAKLP